MPKSVQNVSRLPPTTCPVAFPGETVRGRNWFKSNGRSNHSAELISISSVNRIDSLSASRMRSPLSSLIDGYCPLTLMMPAPARIPLLRALMSLRPKSTRREARILPKSRYGSVAPEPKPPVTVMMPSMSGSVNAHISSSALSTSGAE